jgi:hypothetical protein
MANGPMGGFMPTPAAPAQPPSVKLDTTAVSRGNFNTFLKNMNGAMNPPLAPMVGAAAPSLAPTISDIDIFNQPMQMMKEGGNVAPRQTEIMGQPHMLAYITPQEGQLLEGLGGANMPGPMGIPSFYEFSDTDSSPAGSFGGDDGGGYQDDAQATDPGFDDSPPDDDMDYTDPDYGYTIGDTETGQDDMDRATEFGQQVAADQAAEAAAQAAANQVQQNLLARQNLQDINQTIANQQKAKDDLIDAQTDIAKSGAGTTTQTSLPSAMTGIGGTTAAANIAAAAGTDFSNIGTKGIDQDPLGLSLEGVGLGPAISTPTVASKGPPSGPSVPTDDVTGFGGKGKDGRDVSDFSTDIDALANIEKQATEGSFPGLDKVPGTLGAITSLINSATKTGAQNTLRDISRGFTPTYDKDGNITGTTNFGIGMGQPGGLFGQGTTVPGYKIFDKTSPSIGMYDDTAPTGGDDADQPIILPRTPKPEEEKPTTNIGMMGGANPFAPTQMPTVVDSPFTTSVGDFQGTGFNTGDLNRLIQQITGIQSPRSMAKGGVAGFANGGLIKAVDDFLATGT